MITAFLTHPLFLEHDTGAGHPERAARLAVIEAHLRASGRWDALLHLDFEAATESDLLRCHTAAHLARVRGLAARGGGHLDGDTVVSPRSYEVAALASGAAMAAVDAVCGGQTENAFAAVRPPGHHAESGADPNTPWGFCLFNHVAVAARHAQQRWSLERVAILDFDVHHGNGTQAIFLDDASVFFASLHESPLFPGSGAHTERGVGAGQGFTLNFPLRAGSEGQTYRQAWQQVGEALSKFEPQLIILSAGFDAHRDDPLAHMNLEVEDFSRLVSQAKKWADQLCDGHLVAVLEGGYDLEALAQSVAATLDVLGSEAA